MINTMQVAYSFIGETIGPVFIEFDRPKES